MSIENINMETCIGCGICVATCPMDVIRLDTVVKEKEEYSPCRVACPLGVNQREYINLIKMDMLDEAAEVLSVYHPMPSITGRLCPHPCESECSRKNVDDSVNINSLEEYMGDYLLDLDPAENLKRYDTKAAVIGSGPAGLAAAYFLALKGHEVTVFEKASKPGGLLRSVIPSFRMSDDVLDSQISFYEKMGIVFKAGVNFGKDITKEELEKQGYKAIIAAIGAAKPIGLSVPGADANGVISAMDFLKEVKAGQITALAGKVAVIGGGSVALDASRSAVRLGAEEVNVVCLEQLESGSKDSMLALKEEIDDAMAEGVDIHPSRGVESFVTEDGNVKSIKCVECLSVRDEDGRFNPEYDDCVLPQEIQADTVILAIGQAADTANIPDGFALNDQGYIAADKETKEVAHGLFAVGDAVSGPSTVVEALASGKRAAVTVDCFLRGEDMVSALGKEPDRFKKEITEKIPLVERINQRRLVASECNKTFQNTIQPYNWEEAILESERCLTCGSRPIITYVPDCQLCNLCSLYCPVDAITIAPEKSFLPMLGWG